MMRLNELPSSDFTTAFLFILGKDALRTTNAHSELSQSTVIPLTLLTNPQSYFHQLICSLHASRQHCKPPADTQEENTSPRKVAPPSANMCHSLADICVPKVRVLSTPPDLEEVHGKPWIFLPPAWLHSFGSQLAAGTCDPENYTDYFAASCTKCGIIKAAGCKGRSLALPTCIIEADRSLRGSVTPQLLLY